MMPPSEPEQQPANLQQDVEGSQNQVIGQVSGGTVIGNFYQAPGTPSIADEIKARPLNPRSPYMGLRKFEVRDKDLFFGRDQLIGRLLERLEDSPFLLILGSSGSGKSSLVRAGLIPGLRERLGAGFRELIFTPDRDPFDSLRSCLRSAGFRQADLASLQASHPETLLQTVQAVKPTDEEWLIFIDQFEELFTLCQDLQIRQAVIDGLIQLVQAKLLGMRLVLAMRADFLDRLGAYPQLSGVLKQADQMTDKDKSGILQWAELITDMSSDELRLAIEQPAAHHGVLLEPELTEAIIHDLKGQLNTASAAERVSLPLLQYTLKLLWENSELSDRTLRLSTYRQLGGVRGALQRHMDEIYSAFPDDQKQAAKHIFLNLVDTISADAGATAVGKAVSRRAPLSEFQPTEREVLYQLIDKGLLVSDAPLVQANLSPGDRAPTSHNPTVELAHETLIDAWQPLKQWIEESRPLIRLNNQLKDDASHWYEIYQKDPAEAEKELWQGRRLQYLLSQRQEMETRIGAFNSEEAQFIQACEELSDRQVRAEIAHQRQQKRLYRRIATGSVVALALVTGITVFAATKWRDADHGQLQALLQSSEANFQLHPGSLDSLIDSLKAGHQLQRSPWLRNDTQLKQQVMQILGQSLYGARERNRLQGHEGYILGLSFSPDGQTIATASYDKTIRLWSVNGKQEKVFGPLDQPLTSISISPDGKMIGAANYEGVVSLFNLEGKSLVPPLKGHTGPIWKVAFSPDGQMLATAGDDGTLRFWTTTGQALNARTLRANGTKFFSVAFNRHGTRIAAGRKDGTVLILDGQGKIIRSLTGHTDAVYGVAFSPDGRTVATASDDKRAILWDSNTGVVQTTLTGHTSEVRDVTFSSDGETLATASFDETIKLWNRNGELLNTLQGHTGRVFVVKFHLKSQLLASASDDTTIRLWQVNPWVKTLSSHSDEIYSVDFNKIGDGMASGDSDGVVKLWKIQGQLLKNLPIRRGAVTDLDFSWDQQMLAIANADGTITLLDQQGYPRSTLPMHQKIAFSVAFSPNSQLLATTGIDNTLKLWNRQTQKISTLFTHSTFFYKVSWSPDGQLLAVAADDGVVQLLTPNGKPINTFKAHDGPAYEVRFSPDGKIIGTSGNDKTIKLWQSDGRLVETLIGHQAAVWDIRFSQDGKWLASASDDETIKLWTHDGKLVTTLKGHAGKVNSVSFSPNGKLLTSGSSDKTVMVWDIDNLSLDGWLMRGCNWIQDYLRTNPNAPSDICNR